MDANISSIEIKCCDKMSQEILEKAISFADAEDALVYRNYFVVLTVFSCISALLAIIDDHRIHYHNTI
ncbi:MAG: hypothetical protein DRN04_07660 [Thermoprotei archaeon]|nr:MAG: hypothetical protein DRN04_07660 [Thermoprotei archaeon]